MRLVSLCLAVLLLAAPVRAQDQTLADIRQELTVLFVEIQQLKRELSTTGGAQVAVGGDTLQRVDLIERELSRLTAKTEALENRLNQIVTDGTNRIGDLEFRLCELEAGCDIASLETASTLGGGPAPVAAVPTVQPSTETQFAVGEQSDFDRAKAALDSGDFQGAAAQFATFAETYTGGPLTAQAHFYRGQALAAVGETKRAARAYLDSFSADQGGPLAPDALYSLGESLGKLGQLSEACLTLSEIDTRFPGSALVGQASSERQRLGCT